MNPQKLVLVAMLALLVTHTSAAKADPLGGRINHLDQVSVNCTDHYTLAVDGTLTAVDVHANGPVELIVIQNGVVLACQTGNDVHVVFGSGGQAALVDVEIINLDPSPIPTTYQVSAY